jgi:hypothetical protein
MGFDDPQGHSTEFMLNINSLLGLFLKTLHSFWPGPNWYALFLFGIYFLSTWALIFSLRSQVRDVRTFLFALTILSPVFIHYFSHVEFTIFAIWAAQGGVILTLSVPSSKGHWKSHLFGGTLIFFSSLIRLQSTFLVALLSLPVLGYKFFTDPDFHPKNRSIWFLTLSLFISGGVLFQQAYFRSNSGESDHFQWTGSYDRIVEYSGGMRSEDLGPILAPLGWDTLDFALLENYYWQDPKFNLEGLKSLEKAIPPGLEKKVPHLSEFLGAEFRPIQFSIVFLLFFFVPIPKQGWYFFNAFWAFVLMVALFYFLKLTPWVTWPIASFVSLSIFQWVERIPSPGPGLLPNNKVWAGIAFVLLLMISAPLLMRDLKDNRIAIEREKAFHSDLQSAGLKKDELYVVWNEALPFQAIGVFGDYSPVMDIPVYWLCMWQNSSTQQALLKRFNLVNPFRDMVDRKDVNFILSERNSTMYNLYLRKRFHIEPTFKRVFDGYLFDIFHVTGRKI